MDSLHAFLRYTHLSEQERAAGVTVRLESNKAVDNLSALSWSSLSLTEALYRDRDNASYLFAVSSLLPLVIVVFLSGLATAPSTRSLPALALLLLLCANVALNVALKHAIKDDRPPHPAAGANYTTAHGMPSDHAQFMTFFVVYMFMVKQPVSTAGYRARAKEARGAKAHRGQQQQQHQHYERMPLRIALPCFFIVFVVCVGRVYNGYHTVAQVLTGMLLGLCMALLCTRACVQRIVLTVADHAVVPIMHICTCWTAYV